MSEKDEIKFVLITASLEGEQHNFAGIIYAFHIFRLWLETSNLVYCDPFLHFTDQAISIDRIIEIVLLSLKGRCCGL